MLAAQIEGLRVRYSKTGNARFISHLDLIRVFSRALRRAGIDVAYSEGFNPHAHIVFGLPLSLGASSEAEYADIEFDAAACPQPNDFIEKMNAHLPGGLRILDARRMATKANVMATAARARFEVATTPDAPGSGDDFGAFWALGEIPVERTTKNGTRTSDIKPMVKALSWRAADHTIVMDLDAGSVSNLKPEAAVKGIETAYGGKSVPVISVHRTAMWLDKSGKLLDPMDPEALADPPKTDNRGE